MRAIGLVSELRHVPGIYGHGPILDLSSYWPTAAAGAAASASALITLSSTLGAIAAPYVGLLGLLWGLLPNAELKRVGDLPTPSSGFPAIPPPCSIVVPATLLQSGRSAHRDPAFYGLFPSARELSRIFAAEGGNVDLWILPASDAQQRFRHCGGPSGRLAPGLYLPHPHDAETLVPAREYSSVLRDQVLQDWVRAFEALGAANIIVCDTTELRASAGAASAAHGASVVAELKAQYGNAVVRESSYAPGTFDVSRAIEGKRWIADFAAIQTIIEGRVHGRQLGYRESVTLDISFGLDVSVLEAWGTTIKGGYKRKIELAIEFHPKAVAV